MSQFAAEIQSSGLRGELRLYEPLSRYTSWRVGGAAQRWYRPADLADLADFLRRLAPDEPLFWLGLGSNLLVREGGLRGVVIVTHGALKQMELTGNDSLRVEAGVPCAKAARFSARHGLSGAEFLAGIPGTLGGALQMNAGAWGEEIWNRVRAVETIDRCGEIKLRLASEFEIAYRHCLGPANEWFVAAHLELELGDAQTSLNLIREFLEQRSLSQPTGVASCGSVFRNPLGDYAARLIDTAGLKGVQIGGAQVSPKHANFILNTGNASADDLEALILRVKNSVAETHGVTLTPEVCIVGDAESYL